MRFWQLRVGDFFHAHGDTYLKLPQVATVEPRDANAINATTGQLVFFGLTVPVEYTLAGQFEPHNGRPKAVPSCDRSKAFSTQRLR